MQYRTDDREYSDRGGCSRRAREKKKPKPLAKTPEEVIFKFGCPKCHKMYDCKGDDEEPDLRDIGARMDEAYIRRAIMDPGYELAKGFEEMDNTMPKDMPWKMRVSEFEIIVDLLKSFKHKEGKGGNREC